VASDHAAAAGSATSLVRPLYEHWGRGDWRRAFDVFDPAMEWGWSPEFPGLAGVYADRRDPNPRLRNWLTGWKDWRVAADEYVEIGDHVLVLTRYRGRGRGSGCEVEELGAHVLRLRDRRIVRLEIFADRARAIASMPTAPPRTDFLDQARSDKYLGDRPDRIRTCGLHATPQWPSRRSCPSISDRG
jgi:ketosteroid isomerase-like protein